MIRSGLLGKPPAMRDRDELRMHPVVRAHLQPQAPAYRLHPGELAGGNAQCGSGVVMHFQQRLGRKITQRRNLPALRVVIHRLLRTGDEQQRVVAIPLGCAHRTLCGLDVRGKRVVTPILHHGRVNLELAGRRAEARLFVFAVFDRNGNVVARLQLVPRDPHRLQRVVGEHIERRKVLFEAQLPPQRDHEFPVGLALPHGHQFSGDRVHEHRVRSLDVQMQARFVALQVRCRRQDDVRVLRGGRHEQVMHDE